MKYKMNKKRKTDDLLCEEYDSVVPSTLDNILLSDEVIDFVRYYAQISFAEHDFIKKGIYYEAVKKYGKEEFSNNMQSV